MAERQEIINRVRQRLVDGSMTKEQARQVLSSLPPEGQEQQPEVPAVQPQETTQPQPAQQVQQPESSQPPAEDDQGFFQRAGQFIGDVASGAREMITGTERTGRDIERLPSLFESEIISDLPPAQRAKVVGLAQLTSDPNELAQILTEQIPGTQIQYNRDEQGNVYPLIADQQGRAAIIDKPGLDALNMAQLSADMAAFTPAGRAGTIARGVAGATATEAARQGVQAVSGGEFDPEQVALAGGIEGAGRGVEAVAGATSRALRGAPTDEAADIIRAGQEFDVPVMTTDVVPPRTAAGRGAQFMAETVPVIGTGGMRAAQQDARVRAVDQFVDRFQGGGYDKIVSSLQANRDQIKKQAGATYKRLVPKLDAAASASGIPFEKTREAVEQAREVFSRPGRQTSGKALDVLDDIQESMSVSDQSFQTLKDNIGAWQEAIDSVDPAIRSQLTSRDTAQIKKVLSALRKDRDDFAETILDAGEFKKLKEADAAYGEMSNTMKNTRIKNVLDKGDMTPEVARNMLFSKKKSEVSQLYQNLTEEGRENARATIIADISTRLSNSAAGLTPDRLATELSKNKEMLDVFFRGERRKELNGFLRLLDATRRAQKAEGTFSIPTGQQTIPFIMGAGATMEPSVAAAYGTVGALGRLFESPRVRSVLSRMASAEPGSTQFEQLIRRYREEVGRIAQSIKDQPVPENLTGEENDANQNQ